MNLSQVVEKLPILLALIASLIVAGSAQGQTTVSIQAGTSFSNWGGSDIKEQEDEGLDYGYRAGVAVRASAVLPLSGIAGLQVGAAYVQKGTSAQGEIVDDVGFAEFDFTANMGYLQLPVLLRITPKLDGPLSPRFAAGPVLSINLNCSYSSSASVTLTDPYSDVDISFDESESGGCDDDEFELKTMAFSVTAGVGIDIAV